MVFHPRLIHISIIEAAELRGQAAERPNECELRRDDVNDKPKRTFSETRENPRLHAAPPQAVPPTRRRLLRSWLRL